MAAEKKLLRKAAEMLFFSAYVFLVLLLRFCFCGFVFLSDFAFSVFWWLCFCLVVVLYFRIVFVFFCLCLLVHLCLKCFCVFAFLSLCFFFVFVYSSFILFVSVFVFFWGVVFLRGCIFVAIVSDS